jgi:hypothetical protein
VQQFTEQHDACDEVSTDTSPPSMGSLDHHLGREPSHSVLCKSGRPFSRCCHQLSVLSRREKLWAVQVQNGRGGPITDLEVDAYPVDFTGNRTTEECVIAKGNLSIADFVEEIT